MVRRLEFITNKKERQKAFLRRKTALMKKAHELSVLCDVKLGMMIFSPQDFDDHQIKNSEPLIWPENPQVIHCLIDSYKKSEESLINNSRRNYDSSKVLNDRIQKAKNELTKLKQKNAESQRRPSWDDQLNNLSSKELVQFAGALENKIQEIRFRADAIKEYLNYFSKQSSFTRVDASYHESYDPVLLANHNLLEWQSMHPQYGADIDHQVPLPFYSTSTFGGNLAVVPTDEEMSKYVYGQEDMIQTLLMQNRDPAAMQPGPSGIISYAVKR